MALAAICCEPRRPIATASQEWGCFFLLFFFHKELLPCPLPRSCIRILMNKRERGWDSCCRVMRAKGGKGLLELSLYLVWGGVFFSELSHFRNMSRCVSFIVNRKNLVLFKSIVDLYLP